MISVRRLAAVGAAVLSIALGAVQAGLRLAEAPAEPPAAAALAPLARAPIPAGSAVALVVPAGLDGGRTSPLLYESAWQRPDLRWTVADDPRVGECAYLVALGDADVPPGWRPAWHGGIVTVLVREGR